MAGFKIDRFSGILPRIPESLLPQGAASLAANCDFGYGELRNTRNGIEVAQVINSPASIYTDDGLTFFTWTSDVNAVRSPLVRDTFNRFYFTDGTRFSVAVRTLSTTNGGPPQSSYRVGVPQPTAAPSLAVELPKVDATTATFSYKFHYEYGGVKYQEQDVAVTALPNQEFRFTPPAMISQITFTSLEYFPEAGAQGTVYKALDTNTLYTWTGEAYVQTDNDATPSSAFPVLRITATSIADGSQFYDLYTENSSLSTNNGLYSIALSKDTGAATYTAKVIAEIREADKETRAYVYTYVNTYGEEGPPSPPATTTTGPDIPATVTVTRDSAGDYAPIKEIRIYRTAAGSEIAQYFFAGSVQVLGVSGTAFVFEDSIPAASLNEPLGSADYYAPPEDLVGLMSLPNGILCAWRGNELWFSDAFRPWAWNPENAKPLPHRIVGAIAHGSGAVVTTVGNPVLVSGIAADQMTVTRLNVDQAGVSKWSIAVANGSVVYASNDGLVTITGAQASLAQSEIFFTRDVWRARYGAGLSSMRFSTWDGRLVAFSATNDFVPFMIRFDEAAGQMTDLPDLLAACAFTSQLSDQFYFAWGRSLYQFNGGTDQQATWASREMVLTKPASFGILQTVTDGTWGLIITAALDVSPAPAQRGTRTLGQWLVTVGATSMIMSTALEPGTKTIRLPGGFKSDRWKFRLQGSGRFREMRVATAGAELAGL